MECPFCCSNLPPGSELCPNCMSDLRNANPRGDRGTATDAQTTGYVPPRKGYIPPTQPGGAEAPVPIAPAPPQPGLPVHSAQAFAATAQAGFAPQPSPYAPNAQPAPAFAPAVPYAAPPAAFGAVAQPIATAVSPQPPPMQPRQPSPPVAAAPVQREVDRAAPQGRRETALDSDGGSAPALPGQAPARGRTRLDRSDGPAVGGTPGAHRRVVGWMISFDVNEAGQEYLIREGRNTIGRARDADISIFYDEHVSGTHATIVYRNGEFKLRDEMTNNGTFVNAQDVGPGGTAALKNGDVLRVGHCTFKLFLLDPEEVRRLWPRLAPSP